MKTIQYVGIALAAGFSSGVLWLLTLPSMASQPSVQLKTTPALSQLIPATEPVQLRLTAIDAKQQLLRHAHLQVRLYTPPQTPWLTSDFPIVEGTTLLELGTTPGKPTSENAPMGSLEVAQVLPIRGSYRMEVRVTPAIAGAFVPFQQTLFFSVPENPVKYRNLAILAAILLLAGLGSGWVLGGSQTVHNGEIAPKPVRMLLSGTILMAIAVLLYINITAEQASSHSDHHHQPGVHTATPSLQRTQGIEVRLSGEKQAVVGQLATQTVQIREADTGKPISDVALKVQAIALEHNKPIFSFQSTPNSEGELTWRQQFFDGAPHRVSVNVLPFSGSKRQFQPLEVSHEIEVEGIAPPLSVRLISLGYFTLIYIVGLFAGVKLRRKRTQPSRLSSIR
jgi:hypothetical protein